MFHPDNIAAAIRAHEADIHKKLMEHSVSDCVRVYDHFRSLAHTDGKKVWYQRPDQTPEEFEFVPWEADWIANELHMCTCSFPYWLWRYYFIKDFGGNIRRPDQSVAWQIILCVLAELDRQHLPTLLLFLKARQLGITTLMEAVILWISLFRRGCRNVIASAEEDKSLLMSDMIWLALDNLPLWMVPTLTRDDRRVGPEFGDNETEILIQHGSMKKGIARGSTPTACHASEVAYYPDPIETIESSLIRAMHENPRTFLSLESTARRKGDWFHKTWLKNRAGEQEGYNRFTCIFLPWYVGTDIYPTVDWIRNHPIPENWKPRSETMRQKRDAELYVATTPLLARYMPRVWGPKMEMPIEQMWFWEFNYVEASQDDLTLKSFMAEMASDERSCFQSKKWSVYKQDQLDALRENAEQATYTDYAIVGDGIDAKFSLRDLWKVSGKHIRIEYISIKGHTLTWKLIPLQSTPIESERQFFLRVWERPRSGFRYTIGIDIGGGVGQNFTDMEVLRVGRNKQHPDIQVAQLRSPWINGVEAPPFALCLGAWYGQFMTQFDGVPEAYMAPETQIAVGDIISDNLAQDGYSNFHYMERYDLRKTPGHKSRRRGWATNAWSQPLMQQSFKNAVDTGWIRINSIDTVDELEAQEAEETDSGKTKFDHSDEGNDDSLTGLEIAYFVSHDKETRSERMMKLLAPVDPDAIEHKTERADSATMLARHFQKEETEEIGVWRDGRQIEEGDEEINYAY